MSSKKKVVVAICSLAILVLGAVIAAAAVFAAQEVTIKSRVNIIYTANMNVVGYVDARYEMLDPAQNKNLGRVAFDGDGVEGELEDIGSKDLKSNEYMIFIFSFYNGSDIDDYTASLSFTDASGVANGIIENMHLEAKINGQTDPNFSTQTLTPLTYFTVRTGEVVEFRLKISIANKSIAANFTGTFRWDLNIV